MTLAAETRKTIERARERYPSPRSAVMPSLWAVQHELGMITPDAMAEVATLLGLASSDVEAVASFYSMYHLTPQGRHEVVVCTNISCALRGADDIVAHLERTLGVPSGGTTADGEFTWASTIECLGACGGAPAMQVDHGFQENLTPERVDQILAAARGTTPEPAAKGPGAGRRSRGTRGAADRIQRSDG